MSKIITITFNPCIDKNTTVDSIVAEKKLRCSVPVFQPGGGGLNVSRGIKRLGGETLAVYPAGGHTGKFLQKLLEEENIQSRIIDIANYTRENLIVVDRSNNQQFRFGMPGPALEEAEWKQCLTALESETDISYIVASGSLSDGIPLDIYAQIACIARNKKARFIVDTSGDALKQAVNEGVFLIKPNLSELSSLAGKTEVHAECVDDVAREIISKGKCEVMVVSLAAAGAMLITKDEVFQMVPPVVKKKSTVGAGDSMVAGLVYSISSGSSYRDALRFGIACGTAATLNEGTELFRKEDVDKLLPLVREVAVK